LVDARDELASPDDRTIQFRLKRPFPRLSDALGKPGTPMTCIMPERLALTDPSKPVTEMIGTGPFWFVSSETVSGSRVTYAKFAQAMSPRAGFLQAYDVMRRV
jgi:peptide/nickel transport system substrate-binding protein